MSNYGQPGSQRQLLQPQQWTGYGYEIPQVPVTAQVYPSVYDVVPSAPPSYYDQVPADDGLIPMPESLRVQQTQGLQYFPAVQQQLNTVPAPVAAPVAYFPSTSTTVVNVDVTPAVPSSLTGCCFMGNERSAMAILYVLLIFSFVSLGASIVILLKGLTNEWVVEMVVALALFAPTAILFPASFAAVNGVIRNRTGGLSLLLGHLKFYWWILFLVAIGSFLSLGIVFVLLPMIAPPIIVVFLVQLAFLASFSEITKVLKDYRLVLGGRSAVRIHRH